MLEETDYVFYIGFHNGQLNNKHVTDKDQKVIPCKILPTQAGRALRALAELGREMLHSKSVTRNRITWENDITLSKLEGKPKVCILYMSDNTELVNNIKEWVQLDIEMKKYQKLIREMRKRKNDLTNGLLDTMKRNDIDVVDIKDGKLIYSQYKVKAPLSKKHLVNSLSQLFQNEPEKIELVTNHIMDTREVKIKENIRRKENK